MQKLPLKITHLINERYSLDYESDSTKELGKSCQFDKDKKDVCSKEALTRHAENSKENESEQMRNMENPPPHLPYENKYMNSVMENYTSVNVVVLCNCKQVNSRVNL